DGDVGSNKGGEDVWLGKIDDNGNLLWHQVYGGSGSDYPYYISKTNDGGYLITGYTNSSDSDITQNHGKLDFWVIKTDINGAKVWQKTYGGSNDDIGILGVPSADGTGYIIAGGAGSNDGDLNMNRGSLDGWVFKIDLSGNIVWQKTLGGTGDDTILGIIENSDGSIETAGSSSSPDGDIIGYHGGTGRDGWITRIQHN
ncbi:MAG TPA: hypothetical protein VFV08_11530, partial [Puia sp.]|nr:hypothetical protein [Puia sp.]